jgi:hypothetical protein
MRGSVFLIKTVPPRIMAAAARSAEPTIIVISVAVLGA